MNNSSIFSSVLGLALLLALVIAGAYFGAALISAFSLLLLLLCLSARLWSRSVLSKTSVVLCDGQTACHAGDSLTLRLSVRSRSLFPLIWLDVFLPFGHEPILTRADGQPPAPVEVPMEKPLYGLSERFASLMWQQEITCEEELASLRRGVVRISRVSLQAGDGLGMAASQRWAALDRPLTLSIYPRLMKVDVRPFTRMISDAQTGPRGQMEDVTLLRSSRPYQYGDSFKRINWRHLAMTGRMETNQYEMITPGCITFLLDLLSFRYMKTVVTRYDMRETLPFVHEESLEQMISLVASCLHALHEQGLRFALIIPAFGQSEGVVCRPGSGETALTACMEALAALDYRGQDVRLPADELRRIRRELGVVHLCALTDAPALSESLEALSFQHLRALSCSRAQEGSPRAGELPCLLLSELTGELPDSPPHKGGAA